MPPHGWLPSDLLLYSELLVYLSGAFVYGFIARRLFGDKSLLSGNRALRLAITCVSVWYAGCLVEELSAILTEGRPPIGTLLDVIRAVAWLLSFPLFVHAAWRFAGTQSPAPQPRRSVWSSRMWLVPSYATLVAFVGPAVQYWRRSETALEGAAADVYPRIVLHTTLGSGIAFALLVTTLRRSRDPRLVMFLRWLLFALGAVVVAVVLGLVLLGAGPLWRVPAQLVGLGPAVVLLWFAQRHTVLRLSLSLRTLRHFLTTVAVVLLVMAAGPAVRAEGAEGSEVFRRLVAWSVLLAFVGGSVYSAAAALVARRWTAMRRLIEPSLPAKGIERLARQIRTLEADEPELEAMVAAGLEHLLGTRARFVAGPGMDGDRGITRIWKHFSDPESLPCDRIDAPGDVAAVLADEGLYAAFPVRVAEELVAVLVIEPGAGGGVREGERETIQLVVGQLSAVLELRRLAEARITVERQLGEQERLGTLGLVAASLAHEVKNPLASIKALAQTVHEELVASRSSPEQVEDLSVIVEQIGRLEEVTREILGFARPGGDAAADLAALVRSAVYVLRSEARRRGIELETHRIDESGPVPGSPASWQVAVFNLILNAVHHAPGGSTVVVRLCRGEDGGVVFETENAGPAIDAGFVSRIFEPFVSQGGTGLGLAMAARAVRAAGGTIDVVNEPDRVLFRVELGATR